MAENSKKKNVDIFQNPGVEAPIWKLFGVQNKIENNSASCMLPNLKKLFIKVKENCQVQMPSWLLLRNVREPSLTIISQKLTL